MMEPRWADGLLPEQPQWVRDLIMEELDKREARIEELCEICAATYQLAGTVGAPERFLNALSRQSLAEELLPVSDNEIECMARITLLEAAIRKHRDTVWGSMKVRDPTARELYAVLQEQEK